MANKKNNVKSKEEEIELKEEKQKMDETQAPEESQEVIALKNK